MKRLLLNLLTALALLLFTAVAVLWVRSHFVREDLEWVRTNMAGTGAASGFPLFEHVRTMTLARGGVRFDAETLDIPGPLFVSSGESTPPSFTRRSTLVIGRYPTLRPEWQKTLPALRPAVSWGGFEFGVSQGSPAAGWVDRRWSLTLPLWLPALLTGAWPLGRVVLRRDLPCAGFPVRPSGKNVSAHT
jgi:hypothetical protein